MRRALQVLSFQLLCAATIAAGCGTSGDPPRVAASESAPAGHVVEVSGTVTAAGKPLAVGDTVTAKTVIETGPDGNIVIELVHNLARWVLGPNKHIRVDESLAWREAKHTGPVAEVDQVTTSAGQHVERMTANTSVSAVAAEDKPPPAPPAPIKVEKQKPESGSLGLTGTGEGGGGTGIGIGSIGMIGHGGGIGHGQGYGTGGGSLGGGTRGTKPQVRNGTPQIAGSLPADVIRRVVLAHASQIRYCYERGLAKNPALEGKIVVKFVIGNDGNVPTAIDAGSTLADPDVLGCVLGRFRTFTFPKPDGGIVTVTYPFVFSAP